MDILIAFLQAKINLEELYRRAKRQLLLDYAINLPESCPYPLIDLLSDNFVEKII